MNNKDLIHRLNRIQGQIEGLKKKIDSGDTRKADCLQLMHQVKATQNAIKKFAEAYVEAYAYTCIPKNKELLRLRKELKDIVSSAFAL